MNIRPRRNRKSKAIRSIVRETTLNVDDLVMPFFLVDGENQKQEITSMPHIFRFSVDLLLKKCEKIMDLGIKSIALFPCIDESLKSSDAKESYNSQGLLPQAIRLIKKNFPSLIIISDVAMDPYSSDGHDGLFSNGEILNDKTLEILSLMALCQAEAGADIVAPSDMMDGRVGFIRKALDNQGFSKTSILSYTAKYASGLYEPFRDALDSTPKQGDKKTYQMDIANKREALRELALDLKEGADIVMVKPGLFYLDIVKCFAENSNIPIAVYNVSGEYAMVQNAINLGLFKEKEIILETLTSFKRAGADLIFSYHSLQAASFLKNN